MSQRIRRITEGNRLGRHIEHDERSKAYAIRRLAKPPASVTYLRHCAPFDQGELGSCTGNAITGVLMTDPFWKTGREMTEADAIRLYSEATNLDQINGNYPPEDTGSSGLAVAKAAQQEGWINGYEHAFGFDDLLHGLSQRPGILGINWYTSFDAPLPTGECPLAATAKIRGGHEIQMFRLDMENQQIWCYQSWGPVWGALKNGTFWFSFDTLQRLLEEQGDATFPAIGTPQMAPVLPQL
jgi:hypothetical protein